MRTEGNEQMEKNRLQSIQPTDRAVHLKVIPKKKEKKTSAKLDRDSILARDRKYWIGRRTQDIIFSAAGLALLSPLLLTTAAVIYIDDPHGSPIFTQTRVGRDGKEFKLYKFRSMYAGAEENLEELLEHNEMDGPIFKMKDDPRITRVGNVIRKVCIDELPQLLNILKGEMSIVGPRPPLPREYAQYNDYQKQRLIVTPGLTCYWQVQPHRNDISFDKWVELDLQYIRERSFLTDWKIIFKTIGVIIHLDSE